MTFLRFWACMSLIKSQSEIDKIRKSGRILVGIMSELKDLVRPDITGLELDARAQELISIKRVHPSFKNYRNFSNALCVSINETVVHGVPSERKIKQGDIVSLDLGVFCQGYHADVAVTVPVPPVDDVSQRLVYVAKEALMRGIEAIQIGGHLGDIGQAIESYVKSQGFSVVRDLCGHGIGRSVHEEPDVLNFGRRGDGLVLKPGMVICIEPMVTAGCGRVKLAADGLAYVTRDGSRSAHFEHTVAITGSGVEILA